MNKILFRKRLKEELDIQKTSQSKLATYTGLSESAITIYLNGERTPIDNSIIKIAYYLKINPDYLKGISNDKTAPNNLKKQYDQVMFEESNLEYIGNNSILAYRLKQLIENDDDINNEKLGKLTNVSSAAISNYIRGRREPNLETLSILCDYFNVSIDYIVGRTNYKSFDIHNKMVKQIEDVLNKNNMTDVLSSDNDFKLFLKLLVKTCEIYKISKEIKG